MSDPNDFDPIAASLRRQFSPPPLRGLHDRVAQAADRREHEAPHGADERPANVVPFAVAPARPSSRGWVVGFAVAFAAAVVLLVGLRAKEPPTKAPEPVQAAQAPIPTPSPAALTPQQLAGEQLDGFLRRDEDLPGDDPGCDVAAPPEVCDGAEEQPQLIATPAVELLGECGGTTGLDCADYNLPADRALAVRLMPSGALAILCIESPGTDPHPELPRSSAYNIFRSEVGKYVIYEVTPLPAPQASEFVRL